MRINKTSVFAAVIGLGGCCLWNLSLQPPQPPHPLAHPWPLSCSRQGGVEAPCAALAPQAGRADLPVPPRLPRHCLGQACSS